MQPSNAIRQVYPHAGFGCKAPATKATGRNSLMRGMMNREVSSTVIAATTSWSWMQEEEACICWSKTAHKSKRDLGEDTGISRSVSGMPAHASIPSYLLPLLEFL